MTPLRKIMTVFCANEGADRIELMGKCRKRNISQPRQAFMLSARREGWSFPKIGEYLRRDHTTVLEGCLAALEREREQSKIVVFRSVRA